MEIRGFTLGSRGENTDEAIALMTESKSIKGCAVLLPPDRIDSLYVQGAHFLEAREPRTDRLCGVAKYVIGDDYITIELLCSNCKGTGTALVNQIVKIAQTRGVKTIELTAVRSAVDFYKKVGFKEALSAPDPTTDYVDMERKVGGRRTYRRRRQRKHGSASLRRHKTRRML